VGDVEAVLRGRLASLSLERKVGLLTGADFWSLHPAHHGRERCRAAC
jgi:hypothetical protein